MRQMMSQSLKGEDTMSLLIRRRLFLAGALASFTLIRRASAAPPTTIADGNVIGRGKMLVVQEDASGRILAFDSSTYIEGNATTVNDVIVIGSYCGTRVLAPIFTRGAGGDRDRRRQRQG